MRFTNAKTKREAVVMALEEFNRRHKMASLTQHLGTFTSLASNREIEEIDLKKSEKQPERKSIRRRGGGTAKSRK